MAKVTAQSIPPELAVLWGALTSPGKLAQGADGAIKIKRNKKNPDKEPPADKDLDALRAVAELVADANPDAWQSTGRPTFVFDLLKSIVLGNFNPDYFDEVLPTTTEYLQSVPTSVIDPAPPPYGYRTPVFLPSVPTYPPGSPVAFTPGYHGEKQSGLFIDTYLNWAKITYKPQALNEPDALALMVMFWATDISINTSSRGSRPMLSLAAVGMLCKTGAPTITSTAPPIEKISSLYWRFRMPQGGPPYYNATTGRRIVKALKRLAKIQGSGADQSLILNVANRPMLGRGFNNNDYVTTSFSDLPKIYEVKQCGPAKNAVWKNLTYMGSTIPRCIAYRPDLKIYVAMGTQNALVSYNLVTWNAYYVWSNMPWSDVTYAPGLGLFLAVGYTSSVGRIATSALGTYWSILANPSNIEYTAVGWSEELHIAVVCGFAGPISNILWSDDGVTFHHSNSTWQLACRRCIWVKELGRFIAVSTSWYDDMGQTSTDGKNWTAMHIAPRTGLYDVAWSPKLGYMVGVDSYEGTHRVAFSSDGINWTAQSNGLTFTFWSIEWCPPLNGFIACASALGHSSKYFSPTGHTWTPIDAADLNNWGAVRFFKEACTLVAVSGQGTGPRFQRTDKAP